MPTNECPTCPPGVACKGYPRLWEQLRRPDGHRWAAIHDRLNAAAPAPAYPPIPEQGRNLAAAVGRAIASGLARVDREEQDRRLAICKACDRFDAARGKCTKCGCVARWKAWLATERCPDGKW